MKSDHEILHEVLWSAHASARRFLNVPQLPLLGESTHLGSVFNFSKQFPNSFFLGWQHQVRLNIG
jgi:hypothetical protein